MVKSQFKAGHFYAFRRHLLRTVAVLSVIAVLALGLAHSTQSAYADDPIPSGWTPDPDLQKSIDKKQALVTEYAQVTRGQVSMEQYNADLDAYYAGDTNRELHHPDHQQTAEECAAIKPQNLAYWSDGTCYDVTEEVGMKAVPSSTPDTNYPYSVVPRHSQRIIWGVPQVPQGNGYYCGPAAAQEVLTFWVNAYHEPNHSVWGDPLSQSSLARWCDDWEDGCLLSRGKFLATDIAQGTDWRWHSLQGLPYYYMMAFGMNWWREGAVNGAYVPIGLPQEDIPATDSSAFHDRWITDIDAAFPMIFDGTENLVRTRNGHRVISGQLNGHPSDQDHVIKHWFAVRGYSVNNWYGDNIEYVHYVDSVYGSSLNHYPTTDPNLYNVAQPNNKISVNEVYKMLAVEGYGYVW